VTTSFLAREVECDPRDALDLIGVVDLGVDGALLAVAEIGDGFRLAEIYPAGEFAHDHDVEAFDHLALQARCLRQRRIAHRGTQIGEQAELLAQAQQPGLGPDVIGHAVPLRPADRTEDHGIGGTSHGHGRIGNALLARIIGRTTDQALLGRKMRDALRVEPVDQPLHLRHHFGADAVAGEQQEFMGRHDSLPHSTRHARHEAGHDGY